MTDRTTKILLTLIAVALWGLLLRPLFTPSPAQAQVRAGGDSNSVAAIAYDGKPIIVVHNGRVSLWNVANAATDSPGLRLKDDESLPRN